MSDCYIIAEAGVNHNGSESYALELVDIASECGADAIKFQTFNAERLVTRNAKTATYQLENAGADNQYEMLKALELSQDLHLKLVGRCKRLGIDFLSTPFDFEAACFLNELGVERIKIPSGELTNIPFLKQLASFDKKMILSTGMATLQEVADAISAILDHRKQLGYTRNLSELLTVLHCTSNYPAALNTVNLRAMLTMQKKFGVPVGYSDHTNGYVAAMSAVALGASVIEKHFTLDRNLPGPDHKASLEPQELHDFISNIRQVESCLGNGVKAPVKSEEAVREVVRRSVAITKDLNAGVSLTRSDLTLLRPGNGIQPKDIERVVGLKLKKSLPEGSILSWDDILDA